MASTEFLSTTELSSIKLDKKKFNMSKKVDEEKELSLEEFLKEESQRVSEKIKINLDEKKIHINKPNSYSVTKPTTDVDENNLNKLISDKTSPDQLHSVQKKLFRGLSRASDNIHLVSKIRNNFAQDFQAIKDKAFLSENLNIDVPEFTFTLPDISIHSEDFRTFLEKDLIEKSTLVSLKTSKRLNWWFDDLKIAQKLWPLATTGDGNCLLHAASLGMWGFHDRLLTLRKALHCYLINDNLNVSSFYRRWRWQCNLQNKEAGLILCEEEWINEWQNILKMASTEPRVRGYSPKAKIVELNGGKKDIISEDEFTNHVYESLEELHILALAHVLKRPIVVIADTMLKDVTGEPFAPIPFGGIYLPLQCDPAECNKNPLCLTYDAAHFSALVAMDHESFADKTPLLPSVIPLVDLEENLLPVQFVVDPSEEIEWGKDENDIEKIKQFNVSKSQKISLLNSYLDLVYISKDPSKKIIQKVTVNENKLDNDSFIKEEKNKDEVSSMKSFHVNKPHNVKVSFSFFNFKNNFKKLRKTMSKRFKKNINHIARSSMRIRKSFRSYKKNKLQNENLPTNLNNHKDDFEIPKNMILAALLHTENRPVYHEEMVRNYLNTARLRFLKENDKNKEKNLQKEININLSKNSSEKSINCSDSSIDSTVSKLKDDYTTQCVNTGCLNFGKSSSSYLCEECFIDQKKELIDYEMRESINSKINEN